MLSAAKHLFFLVENKQKQILRFAQDDTAGGLFRSLFSRAGPAGRRIRASAPAGLSG
jgi:hypothetical protein